MNHTKYEFEVREYKESDFYKRDSVPKDHFVLDIIDLAYSTARTICSYHLKKKELYLDVIASLMSHLNFIDPSNDNFLLSESRYNRLRDFSKATRIGEMAQGINALFVARNLNFPYIIDFDLAKEKTSQTLKIFTTGKTPDFVIIDKTMTRLGLFESKGTMNGKPSGKSGFLSDAMVQINAVTPCFEYSLPVCTKFENNNDINKQKIPANRKSSINYSLIPHVCIEEKETAILLKLHYASWFYLVGDFERVNSIIEEGTVPPIQEVDDPVYELDSETDKANPIYWIKDNFIRNVFSEGGDFYMSMYGFGPDEKNFKIGIFKKVIENLVSGNQTFLEFPQDSTNYLRIYPDGTLLYIRSENI